MGRGFRLLIAFRTWAIAFYEQAPLPSALCLFLVKLHSFYQDNRLILIFLRLEPLPLHVL